MVEGQEIPLLAGMDGWLGEFVLKRISPVAGYG
jgi:hypothetical protein